MGANKEKKEKTGRPVLFFSCPAQSDRFGFYVHKKEEQTISFAFAGRLLFLRSNECQVAMGRSNGFE